MQTNKTNQDAARGAEQKQYMAIDQYGQTFHSLGPNPRKALCEKLCRKHVSKMYRDTADGTKHVGYIIGGLWLELFEVRPMRKAA